MNILIEGGDLNPPFVEGTRNIARTHWKELKKRGHGVILLTRKKETNTGKIFPKYEKKDGIKYYRWGNYLDLFFALLKIKKENVNCVHIFAKGLRPSIYLSLIKFLLKKKIIFSLLGYPFCQSYSREGFNNFLKKIDYLIVSSKSILKDLKTISSSKKINYLSYGIDTKRFFPKHKKSKITKIVCLKKPDKNIINAFEKMCEKNKNVTLILDKKLSKEENLYNLTNKRIKYVEYLEDISILTNNSDILIENHPSNEFLDCASPPLLMLEAMSSGMAIISTNIPEIKEVIENREEGYLLENFLDSEKIYHALKNSKKNRKKYGECARKKIEEKHNISKLCDYYEQNIYQL